MFAEDPRRRAAFYYGFHFITLKYFKLLIRANSTGLNLLFRVLYPNGNLLFRELPGIIITY